jgi:hypothetical protein
MATASSPHDFKLMLTAQGQRASGIEQVMDGDGAAGETSTADETSNAPSA